MLPTDANQSGRSPHRCRPCIVHRLIRAYAWAYGCVDLRNFEQSEIASQILAVKVSRSIDKYPLQLDESEALPPPCSLPLFSRLSGCLRLLAQRSWLLQEHPSPAIHPSGPEFGPQDRPDRHGLSVVAPPTPRAFECGTRALTEIVDIDRCQLFLRQLGKNRR
jgi:hypothetical protein